MSIHAIEVVQLGEILPHPNADRMELTHVWGWQCCIGKGQFKAGDKAVYIPPDYLVPTDRPEFAFLAKEGRATQRITVRRFRGTLSQGLLVSCDQSLEVGTNVIDALGITRYEPPLPGMGPQCAAEGSIAGPDGLYAPKFDVDSYQRYSRLFTPGELVVITEKIHGASARFVWGKNADTGEHQQFCGSRTNWWKQDAANLWWRAFNQCPQIGVWCQSNPEKILYGEIFGNVQSLKYGAGQGEVKFAAFAVLDGHSWIDHEVMRIQCEAFGVPVVPLVYSGPFDPQAAYQMAEADSRWPGANHMSEGVVVVPQRERHDPRLGRVCLKVVSNRYLEA